VTDPGAMPAPPARKVAVLTCMDARIDPLALLGMGLGDAHVIRNGGGLAGDDAIRSLALSQHLLGTEEVVVIQHTDCGLLKVTDEEFAGRLEETAGQRPEWTAGAFTDLEASVRATVEKLRESPFLPHSNVRGYVYEIETGRLREVG
jgi:carbonic anhydrase